MYRNTNGYYYMKEREEVRSMKIKEEQNDVDSHEITFLFLPQP